MRIFGLEISRAKAALPGARAVDNGRGWFPLWSFGNWGSDGDREMGSWQRDERMSDDSIMAQATVFTCITLIASDWSKLNLRMVQNYGGVWLEKTVPGYSDLLEEPNHFQTRQQFIESWALSKLSRGNAYILKVRDTARGLPKKLIVLDPDRVTPLVAPDGEVYYQLGEDDLAGVADSTLAVPASEIIHDRFNCLFHPLVGLSPIFASGLAATQSLRIQQNSARFFKNMARPGGMLTAPTKINDETAKRLKETFEKNFEGENIGRLFVAGDGLKFDAFSVSAVDSQVVEQLGWSAKTVAATFHVPGYMVGAEPAPALNNIEAEQQRYYNQCLQVLLEHAEACLDRGLGLKKPIDGDSLRTDFDVEDLLRMDSERRMAVLEKGVKGIMKVDEARKRLGLLPTTGGDSVYMQQQNFSLAALAKRDALEDPFSTASPPAPAPAPAAAPEDAGKAFEAARKELEDAGRAVVADLGEQAQAIEQAAGVFKGAGAEVVADIAAAGRGAVDELRAHREASEAAAAAIADTAKAAAAGATGSVAEAAEVAAAAVKAAGDAAHAALAQAAREAVEAIAAEAKAAVAPFITSLGEAAAAAKAAEQDETADLEALAAGLVLALETAET
jgi:HK97 family phage portal protein